MLDGVSLRELADQVNAWCARHGVVPVNGQAGEVLNERSLRYYRTLGLIDPPSVGGGKGYGEKHRLQLMGIRMLQAEGLPLSRIRSLLYGRGIEDLRQMERLALAERQATRGQGMVPATGGESWAVLPLDDDFLLISRRGRPIPSEIRREVLRLLNPGGHPAPAEAGER
ncbi:MAG TPA: hypothetical protein DCM86_12840 [Verrucomicrobiales bacterium]|nr:hypothetical protein [Verrucomicrobiales bacterium]